MANRPTKQKMLASVGEKEKSKQAQDYTAVFLQESTGQATKVVYSSISISSSTSSSTKPVRCTVSMAELPLSSSQVHQSINKSVNQLLFKKSYEKAPRSSLHNQRETNWSLQRKHEATIGRHLEQTQTLGGSNLLWPVGKGETGIEK